jgi:hypothetical protein
LLVVSATGADSAAPHLAELKAQGVPTLVVNYSNQSWQDLATELGEKTELQQQAKAVIQRFDDYTRETAARLTPSPRPVVLIGYNIGGSYSIGRTFSPQARLLTALGFQVRELPEAMAGQVIRATEFQFISRENLVAAIGDADVFLLSADDKDAQASSTTQCWPTCARCSTSACTRWGPVRSASTTIPGGRCSTPSPATSTDHGWPDFAPCAAGGAIAAVHGGAGEPADWLASDYRRRGIRRPLPTRPAER